MDGLYSEDNNYSDVDNNIASLDWTDDDATTLRRESERFVNELIEDSYMSLNEMIQCAQYRRIGDVVPSSSILRQRTPSSVATENHSSMTFEGSRSLPPLADYRLEKRDIDGSMSQSDWNELKGKAGAGKRAPGEKTKPGNCKVCGDDATGMYFGALVCVPCKTFFLRYEGDNFNFKCKGSEDCEITITTRTQCKFCRYQKCRKAGMFRRVRPANINPSEGQQLCVVCNDVANGVHFGAITCEGCKKFFRRGLTEHPMYTCKNGQNCVINPRTRNSCRYCRYQTCLNVGMSRDAIQMGRPSKLAMENQGLMRGLRHSNSGTNHAEQNTSNQQATANSIRSNDLTSHYLMGNHHPKEEPRTWDWPMEQPSGHPYHTDIGHFAGQLTAVCDLFDSPAKHASMDGYAAGHLGNVLLTPSCSSNSGDRNSSSSCLSLMSSASPDGHMQCTNSGWGDMGGGGGGDISKSVAVQPVPLNALYHSSGGSVQHMVPVQQSYLPSTTSSQDLQLFTKFYHEKNNIPQGSLGVSSTGDDMLHFSPNSVGLQQSWKQYDQDKEMKEMLESLLYPCQTQEHINDFSNELERFDLKYESVVSFMNPPPPLGQQQVTDRNLGGNKNLPDNNGIFPYNCGQPSVTGQKKEPELVDPTKMRSLNNGSICITESPRLSQAPDRSDHFPAASKASSTSLSVPPQTVPCGLPQFDGPIVPIVVSPSAEPNILAAASLRFPPPSQIDMPDEARTGFNSAKEWLVKIQNHLTDDNEFEDEVQEADSLSDELTEICKGLLIDGIPFEQQIERSAHYWRSQDLPDENIMVGAEHWAIFNHVHPLYTNFVNVGSTWNHNLRVKFEQLQVPEKEISVHLTEEWLNENVMPVYKDLAFNYFSQIQGFKEFDIIDQDILLRLAQSQSRILAAVTAWFDPDNPNFANFLPWRDLKPGQVDVFEQHLISYAKKIHARKLDPVEAALFNIVVVIATDYPGLIDADLIESRRTQFLATFRAYTTAKYGTPNRKMELLFQLVPQLRRLGYLHYAMMTQPTLGIITPKSKEV